MKGAQVQSLVRELDPVRMPLLRDRSHAATKDPTCRNQDLVLPNK